MLAARISPAAGALVIPVTPFIRNDGTLGEKLVEVNLADALAPSAIYDEADATQSEDKLGCWAG
jgi:hypothetical protein